MFVLSVHKEHIVVIQLLSRHRLIDSPIGVGLANYDARVKRDSTTLWLESKAFLTSFEVVSDGTVETTVLLRFLLRRKTSTFSAPDRIPVKSDELCVAITICASETSDLSAIQRPSARACDGCKKLSGSSKSIILLPQSKSASNVPTKLLNPSPSSSSLLYLAVSFHASVGSEDN